MEMQPKLLRVLQEREIVQITRISPESPDSPKLTSFHRFIISTDSSCRFVFNGYRLAQGVLLGKLACHWQGHWRQGTRDFKRKPTWPTELIALLSERNA